MKSSAWIPEDDLMLKYSIEAGASLEALAKGAVKFSRGFTLHELRNRWHSLLYDPVVSAQASACMAKVEPSCMNDLKGNEKALEKRKVGSTHIQYSTRRKRIKDEFPNSPNLSLFEECNNHSYSRHGHNFQDHVTLNHDAFHAEGCHSSVENDYINSSITEDELYKLAENVCPLLRWDHLEPKDDTHMHKTDSDNSSAVTDDDILYVNVVAEDTMNDICNSPLLDSCKNVREGSLSNADASTSIQCHEASKDSLFHDDKQNVCYGESGVPSTSHLDPFKLSDGEIICTLNTENQEIPCNDDIFLLIHQSASFSPSVRPQIATDSIDPLSSSADENDGEQGLSAAKDGTPSFTQSQMAVPNLSSEFDSAHPCVGYAFKSESFDTECLHPLSGQPDKIRNLGQSLSVHTNPMLIRDRMLAEDGFNTSAMYTEMSSATEVGSLKMIDSESMNNPSISDHNNSDSDDELTYFSDIEALILGMNLEYAQESCISSEVARHQYNNSNKTIVRMEHTARSSLIRAMSSLGAFAVFYGRHFNYYIKKTEVTIGRSTDDTDVDIDLRKECRANMISRQQATIKMETDGSFTLKNLGKSSISVNGDLVAHEQVAALGSSCLIEIRGMNFVFEINEIYVRRYLDNIIKNNQVTRTTFEWSPDEEH